MGVLVITHYQRILNYIKPEFVHVLFDGRIVESGGPELAHMLEAEGYDAFVPRDQLQEVRAGEHVARPRSSPISAATTRSKYGFHDPENYSSSPQRD